MTQYPYMVVKPNAEHPKFFGSYAKAIDHMVGELKKLHHQFKDLDFTMASNINETIKKVRKIPTTGGSVAELLDPIYKVWYRAELVERRSV